MKRDDDDLGPTADFARGTEPVSLDEVPVRDGRDFIQNAGPPTGAAKRPSGMERQLGSRPLTKRG